jgi:hypothetical protein
VRVNASRRRRRRRRRRMRRRRTVHVVAMRRLVHLHSSTG